MRGAGDIVRPTQAWIDRVERTLRVLTTPTPAAPDLRVGDVLLRAERDADGNLTLSMLDATNADAPPVTLGRIG